MKTEYLNNKELEKNVLRFQQLKRDRLRYELILSDLALTRKRSLRKQKQTEYTEMIKEYHKVQDFLAQAFLLLAENILRYKKFNFIDADDAKQEFVIICFEKIDKFDPVRGSCFSLFTQIVFNAQRQMYRVGKTYSELKTKFLDHIVKSNPQNAKRRINHIGVDKNKSV